MNGTDDGRDDRAVEGGRTNADPRHSRRRVLRATVGLAGLAAVAGCTGGGESTGGDSSNETTPTDTPTTETTPRTTDTPTATKTATPTATKAATTTPGNGGPAIESMCQLSENNVKELTIVGCQSEVQDDSFVVTLRIRNDGNEKADLWNYHLEIKLYDSTETTFENEISVPSMNTGYPGGLKVPPGETGRVRVSLHPASEAAPEKVEAYTITMECGPGRGVYCG